MDSLQERLRSHLLGQDISEVGFSYVQEEDRALSGGLPYAVTLVVHLSEAVVDEIVDQPTHTYFHHYRSVNAMIDHCLVRAGLFLDRAGWRSIAVGASQSINLDGWNYRGRFSHKKAACLAGLGAVGRNSLFLHHQYGPRVRLGTLFAGPGPDCAEQTFACPDITAVSPHPLCATCGRCVAACPSGAILGGAWHQQVERQEILDPQRCSEYMKNHFQMMGRGAVCGICMRVCPAVARVGIRAMNQL